MDFVDSCDFWDFGDFVDFVDFWDFGDFGESMHFLDLGGFLGFSWISLSLRFHGKSGVSVILCISVYFCAFLCISLHFCAFLLNPMI